MEIKEMNTTIARALIERASRDQEIRVARQHPENKNSVSWQDVEEIDKDNTKFLKETLKKISWPTISKVGKTASHAAWLIAQHANHDLEFQKECLELMKEAYIYNDVDPSRLAYLTDRVAVNSRKDQIYGTQFYKDENGNIIPRPIQDADNLSTRREQMGLEPFEIYTQKMKGEYRYEE